MNLNAQRTEITKATGHTYPRFTYAEPTHELHCVYVDMDNEVVVVGDPDMGCYEWMIRTPQGIERYSNVGYGSPGVALRDGLIAYYGLPQGTQA